ncbi:metal-dependent hydrolase [Lysinibacter cavernae]|uniref:metal-dependent hydrolase n=1 Tax=Lysinibacter cavernae TaxID=1640652 RepID=UPI00361E7DE9
MGYNHAISGAAAWVAVSTATPYSLGMVPMGPLEVVSGAVICAGAALLPDADHHNATIAHSVPVVGRVAAGAVGTLTGGHRHGLHSVLAIVGIWFLMSFIATLTWEPGLLARTIFIGAAITTAALLAFALKVLKVAKTWPKAWLFGMLLSAVLALVQPQVASWFPICVTIGFMAHLVGDLLTVGGLPLLWPIVIKPPALIANTPILNKVWMPNGYVAIPILGRTGSAREMLLGVILAGYTLVVTCYSVYEAVV